MSKEYNKPCINKENTDLNVTKGTDSIWLLIIASRAIFVQDVVALVKNEYQVADSGRNRTA